MEGYIQNITDIQKRRNDINLLTHAINNFPPRTFYSAHEDGTLIFCNRCLNRNNPASVWPGHHPDEDIRNALIMAGMKHPGKSLPTVSNVGDEPRYIVYHPLPKRPGSARH